MKRLLRILMVALALAAGATVSEAQDCEAELKGRFIISGVPVTAPVLSPSALGETATLVYAFPSIGIYVVRAEGVTAEQLQLAVSGVEGVPSGVTISPDQIVRWNPSSTDVVEIESGGESSAPSGVPAAAASRIKVAVVDTPVTKHPALPRFGDECGCLVGEAAGLDHGTHIAGIIAAEAGTAPGVGVAPAADLIVAPFRDLNCSLLSEAIAAIECALRQGARVVNLSWDVKSPAPALADVIRGATDCALFVAAAGDDASDEPGYPAAYRIPNLLSVGTLYEDGVMSKGSNCDPDWIDIAAPGVQILSTTSCCGIAAMTGSSHAAGFISGAAARVLAVNPHLSPREVRSLLMRTASTTADLSRCVASGQLDIDAAVLEAQKTKPEGAGGCDRKSVASGSKP